MTESDHTQSLEVAARLRHATKRLQDMADDVGKAKQVREFSSENRKNLLARYIASVPANLPVSKAENMARSNASFIEEMQALEEQHLAAEQTLAHWAAEQCSFEACRSLLSFSREALRNLEG